MAKRTIVLANGDIEEPDVLRARLAGWDAALVVAADGGSRHAERLNLRLDVVIGDLDSLGGSGRATLEANGVRLETVPAQKDETDLELALLYALEGGVDEIVVLGALGGRLDMTLSNVLLLAHPHLSGLRVEMWTADQTAWLIRPPGESIAGKPGDTLSLIPLGGDAQGIVTRGLRYPLRNETLSFGPARGLSNVLEDSAAHVAIREGLLLAVHTPGRA